MAGAPPSWRRPAGSSTETILSYHLLTMIGTELLERRQTVRRGGHIRRAVSGAALQAAGISKPRRGASTLAAHADTQISCSSHRLRDRRSLLSICWLSLRALLVWRLEQAWARWAAGVGAASARAAGRCGGAGRLPQAVSMVCRVSVWSLGDDVADGKSTVS